MGNELKEVELFAPGKWNGLKVTKADLEEFVTAYQALEKVLKVPLKFGHNDEQPVTDGQPALGWVSNVKLKAGKLVADFTGVPDIVYNAIKNRLYNTLSIELYQDVEYKKEKFPFVLSAVALLGADLPAVNVLSDLSAYMSTELKFSKHVNFTNQQSKEEGDEMSKELQAQIDALQAKLDASDKALNSVNSDLAKTKAEAAQFKTESEALKTAQAKAAFSAKKEELTGKLDQLVKGDLITPAQRDAFTAQIKDGEQATLEAVQSTYEALTVGVDVSKFGTQEIGKKAGHHQEKTEGDVSKVLSEKIAAFRTTAEGAMLSFAEAKERVFTANPALAKEYVEMSGEV